MLPWVGLTSDSHCFFIYKLMLALPRVRSDSKISFKKKINAQSLFEAEKMVHNAQETVHPALEMLHMVHENRR